MLKDKTTLTLAGVALVLAALTWGRGGAPLALAGLLAGGGVLVSVIPLLLAAFLLAGLVQLVLG